MMFTTHEIKFLHTQGLAAEDVYDARGQTREEWKAAVRSAGKSVIVGNPCKPSSHRLRTRSGHCIQCDPSKLAYQNRFRAPGYVYIAGSVSGRILKIGTAVDIKQREANLKGQAYADLRDWEVLFFMKVTNAGVLEHSILTRLASKRVDAIYLKDGSDQKAIELRNVPLSVALGAVEAALNGEIPSEMDRAGDWKRYDFKSR